jgi:filamentous hemagglutinin
MFGWTVGRSHALKYGLLLGRLSAVALAAALALTIGFSALEPVFANASGCTDTWTNTAGGSWFEDGNWSKNAPPTATEEACITESGTYTVEMAQKSTVTVKSLTVGGASGTQTLMVASTNGLNAVLTTSAGITNNKNGAITLTNAETSGNNVTIASSISNAGKITTEPAHGGQRVLQGNLTNVEAGALVVNANTSFNGSKAALTDKNTSAIDIASGVQLTASNESTVANNGGKIVATGNGDLLMEPGTTFNENNGVTSGTKPVILRNAALVYSGTGASLIAQHGEGGTLRGNISAGQSLVLESTNGENVKSTASASFSSAGSITLTNSETSGNNATLVISSGTLANSGTITTEKADGGQRNLQGSITNTGTLSIGANTAYDGTKAALTNEGTIDLATEVGLSASNESSLANAGGTIAAAGSGSVLMEPGTSFTEGAGSTSGSKPVILRNAALSYSGSGESLITQHGEGGTLSGDISAGQSLVLESTNGENVKSTASASFSSAGSITLTNSETSGNNASLAISEGTLTNTGTITTVPADGGQRNLSGNIVNQGTLAINANTAFNAANAALTNEGALELAAGKQLVASNKSSLTNGSGGRIIAGEGADVAVEPEGAFTEGAGSTSGSKPVILRNAALSYSGSGESLITQHGEGGTLSGNISAGQSLVLESTNGENVKSTASAGFTSAGKITLTNSETSGNNATLVISSGTLANSGTITTEPARGGQRTLQGNIANTGTLAINTGTAYNGTGAILTNEGVLEVAEGVSLTVSNSGSVANDAGNIAAGAAGGVLMEPGTSFTEGAGTTSGTLPVIVRDGALTYTGAGASTIAQRGEGSTLKGNLASGQSLLIESTCSEHARATAAASFTNGGSITLTNGDSCGNNATLVTSSGTLMNSGTITTEPAHGGSRTLQGNLTNTGTLAVNATTSYNASGATLTNEGAVDIAESVSLAVSNDATVNNDGGAITAAKGQLTMAGGTFNQGLGQASGVLPVILNNAALHYTGKGASTIAARGEGSTVKGSVAGDQVLVIQSTCSSHAKTTVAGALTNFGTINLTNGDSCGNNATLSLGGSTLTNKGTIDSENPHGGARTIEGALLNEGTVTLSAGESLKVTGAYNQSSKGKLRSSIASASSFGSLAVSGSATIAGELIVSQVPPFAGSLGQTFAILGSAELSGTFATVAGDSIGSGGLHYQPAYSAAAVTLDVIQATLTLSQSSGLPGAVVSISGSGYLPGDTVTPTFTDRNKLATAFPPVTVNGSGEFSTEITIPTTAPKGKGGISVKSTQTGVSVRKAFAVT